MSSPVSAPPSAPAVVDASARARRSFRATHTLIYDPEGSQGYNIDQVALLATSGEVPSRVAARLKLDRAM